MKRAATVLLFACLAVLLPVSSCMGAFGLKDLDFHTIDENDLVQSQAGAHPFAIKVHLAANTKEDEQLGFDVPDGEVKNLTVTNFAGLAGNPTAVPRCSAIDFLDITAGEPACSPSTMLGTTKLIVADPTTEFTPAVFNLIPPPGAVLKLGFIVAEIAVTIEIGIRPVPPYNPIAKVTNISNLVGFYASELVLWGVPGDPTHDAARGGPANVPEAPLLTSPRACEGPLMTRFDALSWEGDSYADEIETHDDSEPAKPLGFMGCEKLAFALRATARPTTDHAESPSGLDFDLDVEDKGLANPDGVAASDLRKATVILPEGMTLNPSIAEGLATCSKLGFETESLASAPGDGCPEASKVGTVEAQTPLLEGVLLKGQIFVADQDDPATPQPGAENPFDSLIALYMVVREPERGILVKLAGRVSPNPATGQIETTFGEPGHELPQFPLGHVHIHLREGGRSPLVSPPRCDADLSTSQADAYVTRAIFTPWADPFSPLIVNSSFEINQGVGGGPCPPAGPPSFAPGLLAGTVSNDAKSFSPYHIRITRRDGDQDLTKIAAVLPAGVVGTIAGIDKCSEGGIAAAKAKTGRAELSSPSCPASSRVGRSFAGAGVGSQLTYVPGRLYLAGPYKGDPLSLVSITPAVAGPFDVGTVVVRFALNLNPTTLQVEVDGASSDPIPHILAGIVLKVRDLRAYADRPNFISNPTSCAPSQTQATLFGSYIDIFNPADDFPVSLADRFQAANCARLGFRPKLSLSLKGGTRRGGHPAFKAVVTPRREDANFARAVVTLPRSAFLDQAHIRTICTRVQYSARACPKGSIYGFAKAWTPLVDGPAEGPVYLRSSNHNLPDLVVALTGPPAAPVEAELVGRIDSRNGGIRASFEAIPDAPVSRFMLTMQGGQKGLIVNSRNLCARRSRADARLTGQNGRRFNASFLVRAKDCGARGTAPHDHGSTGSIE